MIIFAGTGLEQEPDCKPENFTGFNRIGRIDRILTDFSIVNNNTQLTNHLITNANMAVLYYKAISFRKFVNNLESVILGVELFNKHFYNSDTALHAVQR